MKINNISLTAETSLAQAFAACHLNSDVNLRQACRSNSSLLATRSDKFGDNLLQCGGQNFKRRDNCFKCQASRMESEEGGSGSDEICNYATKSECVLII